MEMKRNQKVVIPAQAGIQKKYYGLFLFIDWIPAYARMTAKGFITASIFASQRVLRDKQVKEI